MLNISLNGAPKSITVSIGLLIIITLFLGLFTAFFQIKKARTEAAKADEELKQHQRETKTQIENKRKTINSTKSANPTVTKVQPTYTSVTHSKQIQLPPTPSKVNHPTTVGIIRSGNILRDCKVLEVDGVDKGNPKDLL